MGLHIHDSVLCNSRSIWILSLNTKIDLLFERVLLEWFEYIKLPLTFPVSSYCCHGSVVACASWTFPVFGNSHRTWRLEFQSWSNNSKPPFLVGGQLRGWWYMMKVGDRSITGFGHTGSVNSQQILKLPPVFTGVERSFSCLFTHNRFIFSFVLLCV